MAAVVFSDLDGTLLELATYSWEESRPAVERLRARGVPLVLCSSKTRAEVEHYRRELQLDAPFIVENGSAIFIPEGSFGSGESLPKPCHGCSIIELGLPAAEIRRRLAGLGAGLGLDLSGYADLPQPEIRRLTGLDEEGARRASRREYSETLLRARLTPGSLRRFEEALAARGLQGAPGSRFLTVTGGGADKGEAVRRLLELYRREDPALLSVAVGDGANDAPMLSAVDLPYLVQRPDGSWAEMEIARLARVEAVGPAGFRRVVEDLCEGPLHRP